MSEEVTVRFEGVALPARRGEPLAATLAAHGHLALRVTRSGAERGLFCGIGVCQECLVVIDGVPGQRACMVKVDRPLEVTRGTERALLPTDAAAAPPPGDPAVLRPDLLVVGAGPAGLSAAIAARRAGVDVLLVDERPVPGGQYFKQPAIGDPLDDQQREGASLIAAARDAGVEIRAGVSVWGGCAPLTFVATADHRTLLIEPRAAVVATGAREAAWPVPGWTLPGVMTTGAAQTLWRTARRLPGRRVLIAGNGPLNLQLAAELSAGGADIVGVIEAAAPPGWRAVPDLAQMALSSSRLLARGAAFALRLRRRLHHGSMIARIDAVDDGLAVVVSGGAARSFAADVVCLGYGFRPEGELLRLLGADHHVDAGGQRRVVRDTVGRTSVAGLFAVGDCTGLGGAHIAMAEGALAGLSAVEGLTPAGSPSDGAGRRRAERLLARHRRFQAALWRLYAADLVPASTPETLLCRCEEVTFADVAAAIGRGICTVAALKQETRCGMGRCQGRYCGALLETLAGGDAGELSGFAPRMPITPVAIGDLGP